jgi:hypothetical protein
MSWRDEEVKFSNTVGLATPADPTNKIKQQFLD